MKIVVTNSVSLKLQWNAVVSGFSIFDVKARNQNSWIMPHYINTNNRSGSAVDEMSSPDREFFVIVNCAINVPLMFVAIIDNTSCWPPYWKLPSSVVYLP